MGIEESSEVQGEIRVSRVPSCSSERATASGVPPVLLSDACSCSWVVQTPHDSICMSFAPERGLGVCERPEHAVERVMCSPVLPC